MAILANDHRHTGCVTIEIYIHRSPDILGQKTPRAMRKDRKGIFSDYIMSGMLARLRCSGVKTPYAST